MTRLGRASALLAVFAGDYAILMLLDGQLTDFDVSAGVCAVALLGVTLFESMRAILSLSVPGISAASPTDPRCADGGYMARPRQRSANHRRGRMP